MDDKTIGLCLSGGGYRATVFHIGVIWRLKELGLLQKVTHVSSVSGGALTAAYLGLHWNKILAAVDIETSFRALLNLVKKEIPKTHIMKDLLSSTFHHLTGTNQNRSAIAEDIIHEFNEQLFLDASLANLPKTTPLFYFNSTNLKTGNNWMFSRNEMGENELGYVNNPEGLNIPIAQVVAASSGFPPIVSPVYVEFKENNWANLPEKILEVATLPSELEHKGCGISGNQKIINKLRESPLVLADGGVYDNLGLDAVAKCDFVLVSDAGARMQADPKPASDFLFHPIRVNSIIDNQVRTFRRAQLIDEFKKSKGGVYFSIFGSLDDSTKAHVTLHPPPLNKQYPDDMSKLLGNVKTTFVPFDEDLITYLINWGYVRCDSAVRSFVLNSSNCSALVGKSVNQLQNPQLPLQEPEPFALLTREKLEEIISKPLGV